MDMTLINKLAQATTDAEREAIVLELTLAPLPADVRSAVEAAAIPHWFDFEFLSALLDGHLSVDGWDELLDLSFVETFPGGGYAIHEATRLTLLDTLWRAAPDRFRALSRQAAEYSLHQAKPIENAAETENRWEIEEIYHRIVSDPADGLARFQEMATAWANFEQRSFENVERIIQQAQAQIDGGRLPEKEQGYIMLWQARLALLYNRPDAAAEHIRQLDQTSPEWADDPAFAAGVADLRGDIAAARRDFDGANHAWVEAMALYAQIDRPFDRYLVQEKRRAHRLLPAAADGPDGATANPASKRPDRLTLTLLDNIEDAWINGVLKEVFRDSQQTFDLPMVRGNDDGDTGKSGLSGRLSIHRPDGIDQSATADGLSGLFAASGRSLLILGAPGSGKTITLLQLLAELIEQARQDRDEPVPLLFNLSSFGKFEGSLLDWLAEQGYNQYRLSRKATKTQIESGRRFTLLLDGLDEVPDVDGARERTVAAVNAFIAQNRCGVAVCSRISDYRALKDKLEIGRAVVLQPLGNRQIEQTLPAGRLRQMAADHWQLKETLRSPLLLTLFPQAFGLSTSGTQQAKSDDVAQHSPAEWRTEIFRRYAADRLTSAGQEKKGEGKSQEARWLSFLAQQMQRAGTTVFNIEELQPTWLPQPFLNRRWRGWSGLILGLTSGLISGLILGIASGLIREDVLEFIDRLIVMLIGGLIGGLVLGLIGSLSGGAGGWLSSWLKRPWLRAGAGAIIAWLTGGLIFGLSRRLLSGAAGGGIFTSLGLLYYMNQIDLKEKVQPVWPTWQRISRTFIQYSTWGLILGLIYRLIFGMISEPVFDWFVDGLIGMLLGGLIGIIISIFDTPSVDHTWAKPSRGIYGSLRSSLLMSTIFTIIICGSITWATDQKLSWTGLLIFWGLAWPLPVIFTLYGGMAWCQHIALRFVLYWHRYLPLRLVPWLDSMVQAGILRRVGGGYIFVHRSLLEYFADD